MYGDSSPTICECGNPVIKPRRIFCSDRCNKKARQRRWRDTHPEYRDHEGRVYVGPELITTLEALAGKKGMTPHEVARSILEDFFAAGDTRL